MRKYNSSEPEIELLKLFKESRQIKRLTLDAVSEKGSISRSSVARLESCKHSPTLSTLIKYANMIGVEFEVTIKNKD
jgi:transcriptional regulator with XRE-family HTH domain